MSLGISDHIMVASCKLSRRMQKGIPKSREYGDPGSRMPIFMGSAYFHDICAVEGSGLARETRLAAILTVRGSLLFPGGHPSSTEQALRWLINVLLYIIINYVMKSCSGKIITLQVWQDES